MEGNQTYSKKQVVTFTVEQNKVLLNEQILGHFYELPLKDLHKILNLLRKDYVM